MPLASGYATSLWPQDALVTSHYKLPLGNDLPPGQYAIALTLITSSSGEETGTFILPIPVRIVEAARNFAIPEMQKLIGADFGKQIRLLGYDLQRKEKNLLLTLHWQALSNMTTDYKIFVHLFDPATEQIVSQQDILAGGDEHPTSRWVPEEVVSSKVDLGLENVPAGDHRLAVGLYHADERLPIVAPQDFAVSADRLLLNETVRVP